MKDKPVTRAVNRLRRRVQKKLKPVRQIVNDPMVQRAGKATGKATVAGAKLAWKGYSWLIRDSRDLPVKQQMEMCRYLSQNYPDEYEEAWERGMTTWRLLEKIKAYHPVVYREALSVSSQRVY